MEEGRVGNVDDDKDNSLSNWNKIKINRREL
jgi:hypothetical protein